ncbi:MAG: thioredoxin family protein [Leptolyngbyaceae bacterium]|nr:thioredoxin family protein [Leptolyngbyaceae bacterium]
MANTDPRSPVNPESTAVTDGSVTNVSGRRFRMIRNGVIAAVAVLLSTIIFLGTRTPSASASLASLAETATPFDAALANPKPSLVEFYANWCTSCQAMAGDMAELRDTYGDRINFVMLNVDNSKWLPEVLKYRVDGIPHFLFMNDEGEAIATSIGEQPKTVLTANLDALSAGQPLPYVQSQGRSSAVDAEVRSAPVQDDPRSHGAQVVTQN